MATPTQTPINNPNLKSTARKLPIKRKSPTIPIDSNTNPIPNPIVPFADPNPHPTVPYVDPNLNGQDDYEDQEFDDESQSQQDDDCGGSGGSAAGGGDPVKAPPFKFHRIWSEPDEIRFLQGLLGCWSQGLVFPRDLNVFYDRFSDSMPQPYTRSQLSEKLRRLRKKFKIMSGRISRGQDPNRLAPHDRDLLHLCTRLWDPSHASTSPFSGSEANAAGVSGNKRRWPNPNSRPPQPQNLEFEEKKEEEEETKSPEAAEASVDVKSVERGDVMGYIMAKTVLDVFDGSVKEMRMSLNDEGLIGGDLARRWREQRVAELDVFARRLRLLLEESIGN